MDHVVCEARSGGKTWAADDQTGFDLTSRTLTTSSSEHRVDTMVNFDQLSSSFLL
jgi:hypothetical protein